MNEIKVLYDHQIFSKQLYGGISRYHIELYKRIQCRNVIDPELAILVSNNNYLQENNELKIPSLFQGHKFHGRRKVITIINEQFCKYHIKKGLFDIFHPTYYNPYFLKYLGNKPYVITIHDLIYQKFNEDPKSNKLICDWMEKLINSATKIIAVSRNTKEDLIEHYHLEGSKVDVIYHSTSIHKAFGKEHKLSLPDKYLLYVGNRYDRKNFLFLVKSISKLLQKNSDIYLICAGGGDFSSDEVNLFMQLGINNKIIYQKFNDDTELSELYRRAFVFIYPSKYEGFGIPILESFACGCPVALSNTSCFPEIAGDAGMYFNPYDSDSIRTTIERALTDQQLLGSCTEIGLKRVQEFSWDRAAEQTQNFYMSVIKNS